MLRGREDLQAVARSLFLLQQEATEMHKLLLPVALSAGAFAVTLAAAADDALDLAFTGTTNIAVLGDSPYGTKPTDTAQFDVYPALVNSINADPSIALVLHVGDIHSGKTYCTVKYDQDIYTFWTAFQKPVVYTPGDNEWTDCHKTGEGGGLYNKTTGQIDYLVDSTGQLLDYAGGNPAANLELVRWLHARRAQAGAVAAIPLRPRPSERRQLCRKRHVREVPRALCRREHSGRLEQRSGRLVQGPDDEP
jgi:Calcineurin-like phosphoesterase